MLNEEYLVILKLGYRIIEIYEKNGDKSVMIINNISHTSTGAVESIDFTTIKGYDITSYINTSKIRGDQVSIKNNLIQLLETSIQIEIKLSKDFSFKIIEIK